MGKLASLHNLLSPVFFSAILLFTNFRDFPYIIRHVYDRLMHCISGHVKIWKTKILCINEFSMVLVLLHDL